MTTGIKEIWAGYNVGEIKRTGIAIKKAGIKNPAAIPELVEAAENMINKLSLNLPDVEWAEGEINQLQNALDALGIEE